MKPVVRSDGTVTAGNASGINDGAAALLIATRATADKYALKPLGRVIATATAGVAPRIMGMGPVPATKKVLALTGLTIADMDLIELNEAFAAQGIAVLPALGVPEDAAHVNPNGGAIALGTRSVPAVRASSLQLFDNCSAPPVATASAPCASALAKASL